MASQSHRYFCRTLQPFVRLAGMYCLPLVFAMADTEVGMVANGEFAGSLPVAENLQLCCVRADRSAGGPGSIRGISRRGHFSRALDGGPCYFPERPPGELGGMDVNYLAEALRCGGPHPDRHSRGRRY